MKAAICPIDKTILSFSVKDNVRFCPECKRQFWPMRNELPKNYVELQSDLETVSSESGSSPLLLSDENDYRGFTDEYLQKKNDNYLTRYFPSHCKISSRVDNPT